MNSHKSIPVVPPRELTPVEFDILKKLLEPNFNGSRELRKQLEYVKVNQECSDCMSIGFLVDRNNAKRAEVSHPVPVEGEGFDSDGSNIHFAVIVVDGYIDELQVYREDFKIIMQVPSSDKLIVTS